MGPRLYPDESDPHAPPPPGGWNIDPEDRPFYGEGPPRRGVTAFLRPAVYGVFALACAGALWFAYNRGRDVGATNGSGGVPLIHADQGATKIKPTDAGGANVPNQDMQVYNPAQPGKKGPENLLPAPEQPLPKPVSPAATGDTSTPLPVETIGPTNAPKAAPAVPGGGQQQMKPATTSGTLGSLPTSALPPADTTPAPAAKPGAKPAALAPAKPATPAAASGGSLRIQIAATRDEPTAKSEFERLKKAHEDLLGSLSLTVVKADLGDKGIFYRVQAGPVADHDKAEKLCGELKKFAIACNIVKP